MLAEQGRNTRASESADTRRDVAETGAGSREKVADKRMQQQESQFEREAPAGAEPEAA